MDIEEIRREILHDISSTKEGENSIIDYAEDKITAAKKILEKYDNFFMKRTGRKINLSDRYMVDNEYLLIFKRLPEVYEAWKRGESNDIPDRASFTEIVAETLRKYENPDRDEMNRLEEIPEEIKENLEANKNNEYVSNKISDMIIEVIENARGYSCNALLSDSRCKDIANRVAYEMIKIIRTINPEEIKMILDRDEETIINKISNTVENVLEEQRYQEREKEDERESNDFRERIKVDGIDYSEIKRNEKEQNTKNKEEKSVEDLSGDIII